MRAATIVENNGRRQLEVMDDLPQPVPGEGELLVRVGAGGLNRADLVMPLRHRHGTDAPGPAIAGNEFAGTVEARGPGADRFSVGDRVMGFGRVDLRRADHGQSPPCVSGSGRDGLGNGHRLPGGGRNDARRDRHQRQACRRRERSVSRRRVGCRHPGYPDREGKGSVRCARRLALAGPPFAARRLRHGRRHRRYRSRLAGPGKFADGRQGAWISSWTWCPGRR